MREPRDPDRCLLVPDGSEFRFSLRLPSPAQHRLMRWRRELLQRFAHGLSGTQIGSASYIKVPKCEIFDRFGFSWFWHHKDFLCRWLGLKYKMVTLIFDARTERAHQFLTRMLSVRISSCPACSVHASVPYVHDQHALKGPFQIFIITLMLSIGVRNYRVAAIRYFQNTFKASPLH